LYVIVNVFNALTPGPEISRVLVDPIKLFAEGHIAFKSQGGIMARWN
jgi:hypothetical protein